jgi:hypothetical protein
LQVADHHVDDEALVPMPWTYSPYLIGVDTTSTSDHSFRAAA